MCPRTSMFLKKIIQKSREKARKAHFYKVVPLYSDTYAGSSCYTSILVQAIPADFLFH